MFMQMIKLLPVLFLLMFMQSCGKNTTRFIGGYAAQEFEAKYYFQDSNGVMSFLELKQGVSGVDFIIQGQSLNTLNPQNQTYGTHPIISQENLEIFQNKLYFSRNFNYNNTTHDIEEDVSGANITGSKRTDVLIEKIDAARIRITITIWDNPINNNINNIIAKRVMVSL